MKNGIIYGGLIGLSFLILSTTGYYASLQPAFLILFGIVALTLVIKGLKSIKNNMYNGSVNYAQLLFNGVYICVFAAITCGVANLFFLSVVNTNFKEDYLTKVRTEMEMKKIPENEIIAELKIQEATQDVRKITGGTFLAIFLFTMITNTIACAFIRNKDTFGSVTESNETNTPS